MITAILFVAGSVMIAASLVVALVLSGRSRRGPPDDLALVMAEVERALADPVLVQQARRRITGHHSRDG